MKCQKLILLLFFFSCSQPSKEQKSTLQKVNDTVSKEILSNKNVIGNNNSAVHKFGLKSKIDHYFNNIDKTILENNFGGGDCISTLKEYKTKLNGFCAVELKSDCGDYGFIKYRLISSKDKSPYILEKVSKEWLLADSVRYLLKEWIVDIQDTSNIFYREYPTNDYQLREIPESTVFRQIHNKDLNISKALKTIDDSRTASSE